MDHFLPATSKGGSLEPVPSSLALRGRPLPSVPPLHEGPQRHTNSVCVVFSTLLPSSATEQPRPRDGPDTPEPLSLQRRDLPPFSEVSLQTSEVSPDTDYSTSGMSGPREGPSTQGPRPILSFQLTRRLSLVQGTVYYY